MKHARPQKTKTRLRGKTRFRLPKPNGDGKSFEVKSLDMADGRFAVVKRLRERLNKLIEEVAADTTAKQILCHRAIFLLAYLETAEVKSLNNEKTDWRTYLSVLKQLTDVLKSLGLSRATSASEDLEAYLEDAYKGKGKKMNTKGED